MLLTQDYYKTDFVRYGISAVIVKIVGDRIQVFNHGDCFVYVSKNSKISLLPRYGAKDERFTRFQVFGQYVNNTFKNLVLDKKHKLDLDAVYNDRGRGLTVSRSLGDEGFINDNTTKHTILFPEHALDIRTIDDPDWMLITSDGIQNCLEHPAWFEHFLQTVSDKDYKIPISTMRDIDDDASFLLIHNKKKPSRVELGTSITPPEMQLAVVASIMF